MSRILSRSDALRNREALLDSARECFARLGLSAQMDEIARGAGVGIGTLYRHFPSKADIITVILTDRLQRLLALAEADGLPATERFGALVTEVVRLQSCDRSISDIGCCTDDELQDVIRPLYSKFRNVLARLMKESIASRGLRSDVTVDDVLRIVFNPGLSSHANAWKTYARILLSGLRLRGDR